MTEERVRVGSVCVCSCVGRYVDGQEREIEREIERVCVYVCMCEGKNVFVQSGDSVCVFRRYVCLGWWRESVTEQS